MLKPIFRYGVFAVLLCVFVNLGPAYGGIVMGEYSTSAAGVSRSGRISASAYVTSDSFVYPLTAWQFAPFNSSYVSLVEGTSKGARYCTGDCVLEAPVVLPSGSLITDIELDGCDSDVSGTVAVNLFAASTNPSYIDSYGGPATGTSETPGCDFVWYELSPSVTVDNFGHTYIVQVSLSGATEATQFQNVRVYYKLQVSAPPADATFSDVPTTHPFFRFVEALSAGGITVGYGDGRFGVDDYITRGQMAVFLSRSLGLYWPY